MSKPVTIAPWRPVAGTGQSLALSSGADANFTNKVGASTHAVWLSMAPVATPSATAACLIRVGAASTATTDMLLKTTDPGVLMAVQPGDTVHAWGLAASLILYMCEMTS